MILEVIDDYRFIIENINEIIEVSGYKNEYISNKLDLSASNFSAKKKRHSFTYQEIEKILRVIVNDDVEDYFMLQKMRSRKDEETIDLFEFRTAMQWK